MQKARLFGAIAEFYEYSTRRGFDYAGWAGYVVGILDKYCKTGRKGLDVACGTGYFTRALKRAGYNVTGMDSSSEMLTMAQKICRRENLYIPYMQVDMTSLKSFEKSDFLTVINDGINFVPPEKLSRVFGNFAHCLKKGGILHFDISSVYRLKNIIGNNTFCEDDDDYAYIWFNELLPDRVVMSLSAFIREDAVNSGGAIIGGDNLKDDLFIRRECKLTEFLHDVKTLENVLNANGFEIISTDGDMKGEPSLYSERLNITAVKK